MRKTIDIGVGDRYSKLTVISGPYLIKRRRYVDVKCDCGQVKTVKIYHLKDGNTKSCGCYIRGLTSDRNYLHGISGHPIHKVWSGMIQRCFNPKNRAFKNYGGRGVTVCEEWKNDFKAFYDWAIKNGWAKGLEIDRENNNGIYEPGNCRWVTRKVNSNNRRCSHIIEFNGQSKTAKEWAEAYNIPYTCLINRINLYKWPIERALTTKLKWTRT